MENKIKKEFMKIKIPEMKNDILEAIRNEKKEPVCKKSMRKIMKALLFKRKYD